MSIRVDRIMGHTFVASAVAPGSLVIDLGGNRGTFAATIVERVGVRCVVYEPNPAMYACIPDVPGIAKRCAAATPADGPVSFYVDENPEASSLNADPTRVRSAPVTVQGRSLETIFAAEADARVALLKVDIEGAETSVFAASSDATLQRCDQISIEFHELFGWTSPADIRALRRRMQTLGFRSAVMSAQHYGDVLFLNERTFGRGPLRSMLVACQWFRARRVARVCVEKALHKVGGR